MRRVVLSDGKHSLQVVSNNKPEFHALVLEKKEDLKYVIASVTVKSTPHPSNPAAKLCFLQSLTIVQEGVAKIGEPKKYEPEDIAKATVTVAAPHTEVFRPPLAPCFALRTHHTVH